MKGELIIILLGVAFMLPFLLWLLESVLLSIQFFICILILKIKGDIDV